MNHHDHRRTIRPDRNRHAPGRGRATLIAVLAALGMWAEEAEARGLNQRVAIGVFRGPRATALQDAVEGALMRRYRLVPEVMVNETARQAGVRMRSNEDFADVARTLNLRAYVTATVTHDRDWRVDMVVRRGETGAVIANYGWSDSRIDVLAASLARATPKRLRTLLSSPVRTARPQAEDAVLRRASVVEEPISAKRTQPPALQIAKAQQEREPDAEVRARPSDADDDSSKTTDDDDDNGEGKDSSPARPYLELAVGGRVFSRSMSFADNIDGIPGYQLDRATALTVDVAFHPFGLSDATRNTWAAGLGLTGNAKYALGIGTQVSGAEGRARSEVHGYEFGARYRAAIGIVDLVPHVEYAVETFLTNVSDQSPDVGYRVVRTGLATRLAITRQISARLQGDYLHVLSAGPLTTPGRFPRATAKGVDLSAGAGYGLNDSLEVQLSVGMRRYGFDMHAQPGDTPLAGGAIDEYVYSTLGLAYRPAIRSR